MRRKVVVVALCVGVFLGYGFVSRAMGAQPRDCNVSKAFGTFRVVTAESWLLFEDEGGTLRAVDFSCHLQRVISRQ